MVRLWWYDGMTFLSSPIFGGKMLQKSPKCQRAPHNVNPAHRCSQGSQRSQGGQGARASPIEMSSMIKMWQKSFVSSVSVSLSIFAYNSTGAQQSVMSIFVEHWGGIICNFTSNLPYFQHWGRWTATTILLRCVNLVKTKEKNANGTLFLPDFFPELRWRPKKIEHFFSPNFRSDVIPVPIKNIAGDADVDHSQTIGGDTAKLLGGYIPPGFGTPDNSN